MSEVSGVDQPSNTLVTTYFGLNVNDFNKKYGHLDNTSTKFSIASIFHSLSCSKNGFLAVLEQRVPAIKVLRKYQFRRDIIGDVVSGLSVGVMTIPQSMGYALLAAVPGYYGLYASIFPVLVYFMFGTSRHVSIGTMALSSLVIRSAVEHDAGLRSMASNGTNETYGLVDHPNSVHVAVSISLTAGIFLFAMSFFRLGFIVTYMSDSFISGYLAASNFLVLTHQIKLILGVPTGQHSGAFEFFFLVYDIFRNITETNLMQLLISAVSITCLVLVKQCVNERFKSKMKIPVPIDLLLVIISIIICHFAKLEQLFEVKVLKDIPLGIPVPVLPSPVLMYRYLFEGFLLAIVSYMMVAMMATLFAQRHQYQVDNNQELAANGLACIIGSFVSCIAASTSPPRCFLMESTGGRTQVSYLVSSCLVFITVMVIAPLFYSLPKCVLASIVIVACIPLFVHYTMWLTYWRVDRYDFSIWVVTFAMTFIAGVDYGLIIGVGFSLAVVHFRMQHSKSISLLPSSDGNFVLLNSKCYSGVSSLSNVVIFQFNGPLYFATSSVFKRKLQTAVESLCKEERRSSRDSIDEQNVEYRSVESAQNAIDTEECHLRADMNSDMNSVVNNDNLRLKPDDDIVGGDIEALTSRQNLKSDYNVHGENGSLKPTRDHETVKVIIINCCGIPFIDTGGATTIAQVCQSYSKQSIKLVLACCTEDVLAQLENVAQCRSLLSDSVFPSVQDALISCNPNVS